MDFVNESSIECVYEEEVSIQKNNESERHSALITALPLTMTMESHPSIEEENRETLENLYEEPYIYQSMSHVELQTHPMSMNNIIINKRNSDENSFFLTGRSNIVEVTHNSGENSIQESSLHCLLTQYEGAFGVLSKVYCSLKDCSTLSESQFEFLQQFDLLFEHFNNILQFRNSTQQFPIDTNQTCPIISNTYNSSQNFLSQIEYESSLNGNNILLTPTTQSTTPTLLSMPLPPTELSQVQNSSQSKMPEHMQHFSPSSSPSSSSSCYDDSPLILQTLTTSQPIYPPYNASTNDHFSNVHYPLPPLSSLLSVSSFDQRSIVEPNYIQMNNESQNSENLQTDLNFRSKNNDGLLYNNDDDDDHHHHHHHIALPTILQPADTAIEEQNNTTANIFHLTDSIGQAIMSDVETNPNDFFF